MYRTLTLKFVFKDEEIDDKTAVAIADKIFTEVLDDAHYCGTNPVAIADQSVSDSTAAEIKEYESQMA
jgi:hypothetical protein